MKLGIKITMLLTMMIFMEFVGVPTGLGQTLGYFGIEVNQETHELITADIESSSFWGWVLGNAGGILLTVSAGAAIIIGFFAKSYDTSLVILPLIVAVAGWMISTFWLLIKYVDTLPTGADWMTKLVATIFFALGILFAWACVDYFAGR